MFENIFLIAIDSEDVSRIQNSSTEFSFRIKLSQKPGPEWRKYFGEEFRAINGNGLDNCVVIDDCLSIRIKSQDDIQEKVNQIKSIVEKANKKTVQYIEQKKEHELRTQRIEMEATENLAKIRSKLKDINL